MTCHDTKENAGLNRFIPDSKTITIRVVSYGEEFLSKQSVLFRL